MSDHDPLMNPSPSPNPNLSPNTCLTRSAVLNSRRGNPESLAVAEALTTK